MTSKRAVVYSRQSLTRPNADGEIDDSLSIEVQTRACREYIAKHGWELAGTFEDPDQKGWKAHRPAFDQMLQRFRDGGADICVVFKLSRFARDLMHQERIIGEIADAGGELASVTEPYISTSPMVRQILGAVNEQARRDQGDFLRAAFAGRARRGHHHGGAPFGYQMVDGALAVDPALGPVVQEVFRWALAGAGSTEIAARLNERNIPTPRAGGRWYPERVLRLLRRPAYCGRIVLNGEIVAEVGTHAPLVDTATFDAVQAVLDRRKGVRRKASPSWVDGFVWHACGRRMYAARHDDATTRRGWRYRCGQAVPARGEGPACTIRPASMVVNKIEDAFVALLGDALASILPPDAVAARIEAGRADDAAEREKRRRRIERRIADVTGQRDRLLDMTLRGSVTEDVYIDRDAALRAELTTLRRDLDAVPGPVDTGALASRHATLMDARLALAIAVKHAPGDLPSVLHALDVRLVIGGECGPALQWGEGTALFFDGS